MTNKGLNLTKGKITKLMNKKKQTRKRVKKVSKKTGKGKTFRKNKFTNLAHKTLKKYKWHGGEDEDSKKSESEPDHSILIL